MSRTKRIGIGLTVTALLAGVGIAIMLIGPPPATATTPPQAPRAVPVDVAVVRHMPVRLWTDFSARLTAVDRVELRPQISGTIVEVRFTDGEMVEKGQVLFVIDPRPYQASVDRAKAELGADRDRRTLARKELQRAKKLLKTNAISRQAVDELESVYAVRASEVEAAATRLEQARIDLDYAFVKAPISGRTSRAEITAGNLVQAGANAPLLTSIVSNDGLYAEFEVDEATYFRHVRSSARDVAAERHIPVRLLIDGFEDRPFEGRIHTFDNRIDPGTGTIRARALFDNADGVLLPGMFARVELGSALARPVVLLNPGVVQTDQDRRFVYVVDADGKASYRRVTLGASVAGERIIASGLSDGDRVIVGGVMSVRPGSPVAPREVSAQSAVSGGTS
jgi:multidrug efflux system membrane fusion protein